jgi:hypothetical protein
VVDVEHRGLAALEDDDVAINVEQQPGVGDHGRRRST